MKNLYNIKSIRLAGKLLNDVQTEPINGNQDWSSQRLVSMKAIKNIVNKSNTRYVEYTDMVQNACFYFAEEDEIDENKLAELVAEQKYTTEESQQFDFTRYRYFKELYYGFTIRFDKNTTLSGRPFIESFKAFNFATRILIPSYLREINSDEIFEFSYTTQTINFRFTNENLGRIKKFVVSDDFTMVGNKLTITGLSSVSGWINTDRYYNYTKYRASVDGSDLTLSSN